ncbi:hypothetical protein FRX31_002433 [Thalictrum thalictroides]|uniref:DUF7866 domain-containing protein n=1 Tax=Thalictrum thalictroides TaxID=46969 RepID=A0A7J6XG19_THATH|nr:hypothetical protein FRX31_002433 [Thalictrum thalictroides]
MYISINKISAMVNVLVLLATQGFSMSEYGNEPMDMTESFVPVELTKSHPIFGRMVADQVQNGKPFKKCLTCKCCPDGDQHSSKCAYMNCCYGFECIKNICTFKPLVCNCNDCSWPF